MDLLPDIMMLCKVVSMFQDRMIYQAMTSFLLNTSIFLDSLTDKDLKDASLRTLDNVVAVGCDILNQCSDEVSLDRTITAICNVLIASPYSYQVMDEGAKQHIQKDRFTSAGLNHKYEEATRLLLSLDN